MRLAWPTILLVATNLVPLVGVVGFGWSLLEVMLAFWLQGLVLVGFAALRLAASRGWSGLLAGPLYFGAMLPALLIQLGLIVLYFLVVPLGQDFWGTVAAVPVIVRRVAWAGLVLVLAQAVAFALFLRSAERRRPAWRLVLAPTAHTFALYVVTCTAGVFVQEWGRPALALAVLVLLKAGVDVAELALEKKWGAADLAEEPPAVT